MAVWVYDQDFEGLSTGNLPGQDSWTYVSGAQPQVQTSVVENGSQAISGDPDSNVNTYRDITAVDSDGSIAYFSFRIDNVGTVDNWGPAFADAGNQKVVAYINAPNAGDISLRDPVGGSYTTIATGNSANTWYRIGVEFDFTNNRARGNIDGGAMSAWRATPSYTQITRIYISGNNGDGGASTGYIDRISPDYAPPTPPATFTASPMIQMMAQSGGLM